MTFEFGLTKRQKAILEYIRNNPKNTPLSKEDIIRKLTEDGVGSRVPIRNDIDELVKSGIVYIHKEKPNSQVHYVRIKEDSILSSVIDNLERFRELFLILKNELKRKYLSPESKVVAHVKGDTGTYSLQMILQHFIGIYTLYLFFVWPNKVANKEELYKLHTILFETTKEIQIELSEVLSRLHQTEIVRELFFLKSDKLYETIRNLEDAEVGKDGEEILDLLWKIGFRFVPDALYYEMRGLTEEGEILKTKLTEDRATDWRNIVKDYVNRLPPEKKVWPKAVSDEY